MADTFYTWNKSDLLLELQVQAKAAKNNIIGEYNKRLKIAITTAPENGRANIQIIKFLAKHFGVQQKQIKIIKGHKSKYKTLLISNPEISRLTTPAIATINLPKNNKC